MTIHAIVAIMTILAILAIAIIITILALLQVDAVEYESNLRHLVVMMQSIDKLEIITG